MAMYTGSKVVILLLAKAILITGFAMDTMKPNNVVEGHVLRGVTAELIGRYDAFLIDQWGVLHDGRKPYPGALDLLETLRKAGKATVMISNSSKRDVRDGMSKVGIDSSRFFNDRIVTSGHLAFELLSDSNRLAAVFPTSDKKCSVFVFGSGDGDREFVQDSGHRWATSPEDATLLLARGTFAIGERRFSTAEEMMENVDPVLAVAASRRLPLLVSNPDFHRPGSGAPMPGQIANRYSQLLRGQGDESKQQLVHQIGKPYAAVFEAGVSMLPPGVRRERVCMVGDSLEHDVLGARLFGIDCIWITNGVHSADLGVTEGSPSPPAPERVANFLSNHRSYLPTWQVAAFQCD